MRNRIRKLRQELQMTQEELAQRCRVSRQTIISLEKGKYDPSIHLAHRIATIFSTSYRGCISFYGRSG